MPLLCLFGRHDGYWTYADPEDRRSCRQFRLCQRCHATEERTWHDYQIPADGRVRYLTDDECYAQGACTRCHVYGGNMQTIHDWADFQREWDDDGQITMVRSCRHCGGWQSKVPVYID